MIMAVLAVRSVLIIIHSLRLGEVAVAIKEVVVLPSPPPNPPLPRGGCLVFGLVLAHVFASQARIVLGPVFHIETV